MNSPAELSALALDLHEARAAFREALAAQDRAFARLENSTAENVAANERAHRACIRATNKAGAHAAALHCRLISRDFPAR